MLLDDPFEIAERDAGRAGACPVTMLDAFFTDHWDFDSLCGGFACRGCAAEPEDMRHGGPAAEGESGTRIEEEGDLGIPF